MRISPRLSEYYYVLLKFQKSVTYLQIQYEIGTPNGQPTTTCFWSESIARYTVFLGTRASIKSNEEGKYQKSGYNKYSASS